MKHATLYKLTSVGKVQEWKIWTDGATIFSRSGQLGGKAVMSKDVIAKGKNIGRVNETTAIEQAESEAQARWVRKKKAGYVETIDEAMRGQVDGTVISGGYVPMLAKVYEKAYKHITFPCAVQPKLDGIRACHTPDGLFTRTRKPIASVPHVESAIKKLGLQNYLFDGELYNHDLKDDFEIIVSSVRRSQPAGELIEYHIYDLNLEVPFIQRHSMLASLQSMVAGTPLRIVPTYIVYSEREMREFYDKFLDAGYEGAMARNIMSPYESKRSSHLQKLKTFEDAEFKIVGVVEGRGKLAGHVGAFVCETNEGQEFRAKAEGSLEKLREYFEDHCLWSGKMLTVRYQGMSNKNNVPRFPVGVRIRERGL